VDNREANAKKEALKAGCKKIQRKAKWNPQPRLSRQETDAVKQSHLWIFIIFFGAEAIAS